MDGTHFIWLPWFPSNSLLCLYFISIHCNKFTSFKVQIERKLSQRTEGVDVGYWESLLSQLKAHLARARLRDKHSESLRRKLELLKSDLFCRESILSQVTLNELLKLKIAIWGLYFLLGCQANILFLSAEHLANIWIYEDFRSCGLVWFLFFGNRRKFPKLDVFEFRYCHETTKPHWLAKSGITTKWNLFSFDVFVDNFFVIDPDLNRFRLHSNFYFIPLIFFKF